MGKRRPTHVYVEQEWGQLVYGRNADRSEHVVKKPFGGLCQKGHPAVQHSEVTAQAAWRGEKNTKSQLFAVLDLQIPAQTPKPEACQKHDNNKKTKN